MNDQQTITGKLNKFLYQTNSGWAIGLFKTTNGNGQVKIKGQISLLEPKAVYELTGTFQDHPKYGKNFDVISFKLLDFTTNEQYLNFFKDMIPGIGLITGQKIVEVYSPTNDLFAEILKHPEKLETITGLRAPSKVLLLKEVKNLVQESQLTSIFFQEQLKMEFLIKLKNEFVNSENRETLIQQILSTDFYRYAKNHHLTPFSEVDKIAMHFQKLEPTSLIRLVWNLNNLLEEILQQSGNTYTQRLVLWRHFQNALGIFDEVLFDQALQEAINLKLIYQQSNGYFSDQSWNDELLISHEIIQRINDNHQGWTSNKLQQAIEEVEKEMGFELKVNNFVYDAQQKLVLQEFMNQDFFLLNGGPGTGKTTVLKGMVKLFEKLQSSKPRIAIVAPTGRAAARINELDSQLDAKTIHKLLQATEDGTFAINALNPLEEDLLIVDEASMIDQKLFASLLDATHQVSKIVIIGDENQLPSVGYGEVFANLLQVKEISKIHLNQVHRQQEGNGIIDLAYQVLNGQVNDETAFNLPNITTIFDQPNLMQAISTVFSQSLIEKNLNEVQVITSFYKGELGINEVNQNLQTVYQTQILKKILNQEAKHHLVRNQQNFYVGDKVMYLVNDSAIGLSNGDVGFIQSLNITNNKLDSSIVNFSEEVKNFTMDNFTNLTLSYGCSVHKTQGSEYDEVIFLVEQGVNEFFLNKKLVYTAITRAKKHLYLIGDLNTLIKAINREAKPRKTGLVGRMNALLKKEYNL